MELKESFKSKRIQIIFLLAGAIGGFFTGDLLVATAELAP
jgi:hypothetical protein